MPVSISGTTYNFFVTLDGFSAVTDAVATKLGLRRGDTFGWNPSLYVVMGLPAGQLVTVPDVLIGSAHMTGVDMFVAGTNEITMKSIPFPEGDAVGGALGTSVLAKFDVEFDFKTNKLNLFMPGHCG
ncbi:MAG TPA: hypothetical protein VL971_01520, partial [Rhizomicrobium sp.]|nr:hypothetical protein [Rhizomicrobium sp.]